MSEDLYFKDLVKGVIAPEAIDEKGKFDFLVTLKTRAYEEGHILWLKSKFKPWFKEIEEIPGVLATGHLAVKKASSKSEIGSIQFGVTIIGGIKILPDANTTVAGNVVCSIRKSCAEIVLYYHRPKFNYENPLFYAIHDHCYQATPCCSDWKKGNRRLKRRQSDNWELGRLIDDCGGMLKDFKVIDDNNVISIILRWKQDATEQQRDTLEKVIKTFFRGKGFELTGWNCKPERN